MKARIIISRILLFVSFIMLTASVFPHHHHRDLLCMQSDITSELNSCNAIGDACCNHDHSSETSSCQGDHSPSECSIHCVTNFNCSEPDVSYDTMEPCYTLECLLFNLIHICELSCCYDKSRENSNSYYNERLYCQYFEKSFGLRAPPMC